MDPVRQIARMFHDEHMATLGVLQRLEALLHTHRDGPPADGAARDECMRMMREIEVLIAGDLAAHFAFEEDSLFPLLAAAGDGAMGELLTEEHGTIRDTAGQLAALCRAARDGGPGAADWRDFRRLGLEFAAQLNGHIEKEETGLVPALDEAVDEDGDADLVMAYSAAR